MSSIVCPLCGKEEKLMGYVNHCAVCLRQTCIAEYGCLPPCTCNTCKGRKTHDGDTMDNIDTGAKSEFSMRKESKTPTTLKPQVQQQKESKEEENDKPLAVSQMIGKCCVVDGKTKAPSACPVPYVFVGKFTRFKICKKSHLTDDNDAKILCKIIDARAKVIKEKGDESCNFIEDSLAEDENSE